MSMRSFPDRVRHAVMFEVLALALVIPGSAYLFDKPVSHMGVVGLGSATIATVWNFVYNIGFDHVMQRLYGHVQKSIPARIVHVALFEGGLLALLIPLIAWYLGMGLWDAFVMDLAIVVFYVVYTFIYNLAYDRIFPIPQAMAPALHAA